LADSAGSGAFRTCLRGNIIARSASLVSTPQKAGRETSPMTSPASCAGIAKKPAGREPARSFQASILSADLDRSNPPAVAGMHAATDNGPQPGSSLRLNIDRSGRQPTNAGRPADQDGPVYWYLTGPNFRHRIDAIVEKFEMQADLDRERRTMTRLWAKTEDSSKVSWTRPQVSTVSCSASPAALCRRSKPWSDDRGERRGGRVGDEADFADRMSWNFASRTRRDSSCMDVDRPKDRSADESIGLRIRGSGSSNLSERASTSACRIGASAHFCFVLRRASLLQATDSALQQNQRVTNQCQSFHATRTQHGRFAIRSSSGAPLAFWEANGGTD
jgi:hypothetical protein